MDAVTTPITNFSHNFAVEAEASNVLTVSVLEESATELGIWLSGLESFLRIGNHSIAEDNRVKSVTRDWSKEFRLTHLALIHCSDLILQIDKMLRLQSNEAEENVADTTTLSALTDLGIDFNSIYAMTKALRDVIVLNEGMLRAAPIKFGEWSAWCNILLDRLKAVHGFDEFIAFAEKTGEAFLPESFQRMLKSEKLSLAAHTDLQLILPRFARILKWLSVIEQMLKSDAPLKPALLVFSRVYEQIQELTAYINNRLLRFSNEDEELFGALDGAAYTASIELRKVYNFELAGLVEIRSSPSVYAKMETACALLTDSFQQTLVSFAYLIDPTVEPKKLFPNFDQKLKQSLVLRENMWKVLKSVQSAEQSPEKPSIEQLHAALTDFRNKTLHFLFYKDMETVERFIEEVLVTANKKDLVPILHRFGAYLETLFGQINMRVVLANEPFSPNNR